VTAWEVSADLAVVGTGVAGLTAALRATELGLRVVVITKASVEDGNTRWAQGGVAVVLPGSEDSVEAHVADTVAAGGGLCEEPAVRAILAAGPVAVRAVMARGAVFDHTRNGAHPPALQRSQEGGHRAFRVIHAGGDATGAEIERVLAGATRNAQLPLLERSPVIEVLRDDGGRVAGVALLDGPGIGVLRTRAVLLATGGLGQLYAVSTNSEVATGDGLALALRAGAVAADVEFVQFHPTALYLGTTARGRLPLVTEAIRGEGAVLLDTTGAPVMSGVHPLGGLAPRDVVAAAITNRMVQTGSDHVLLDATHLGGALRRRFPTVHAICVAHGLDPSREPIPVAPAAHYHCGGVVTDTSGRTTVPGLYAAGEVARTGLHGANRLASNSLLEGLVMGARAAEAVAADLVVSPCPGPPLPVCEVLASADRDAVQRAMSAHAGIGRDAGGLAAAAAVAAATTPRRLRTPRDAEDAALTLAAAAVLAAAAARTETRGCHVRTDYPSMVSRWRRSIPVVLDDTGAPVLTESRLVGGAA
jgi:L-aspartate oxidase